MRKTITDSIDNNFITQINLYCLHLGLMHLTLIIRKIDINTFFSKLKIIFMCLIKIDAQISAPFKVICIYKCI